MSWWKVTKSYGSARVAAAPEVDSFGGLHVTLRVLGFDGKPAFEKANRHGSKVAFFPNQQEAIQHAEDYLSKAIFDTEQLLEREAVRLETLRESLLVVREQRSW